MDEPWQRLPAFFLKQLQYFATLAQLCHFTDIANRLAINQPALNSTLRQIETIFGGKLVNRTASTITLTKLGTTILPHAQWILSIARAVFFDMQQIIRVGGDGTVCIGLVPSVSSLLSPLLPRALAQTFPHLHVEFYNQTNNVLTQALLYGEIDFGIRAIDSSVPAELLVYPLHEDPFVVVLHRGDPLAAQAYLSRKQLVRQDIAIFSKSNVQRLVVALVESHRPTLTTCYQVGYIEALYGLIHSRLAVAILSVPYTIRPQDPAFQVAQSQQSALTRTVTLMRGPQTLLPLIEACFSSLQEELRHADA